MKKVKRKASVGEYIEIVNDYESDGHYKNGDIYKVNRTTLNGTAVVTTEQPMFDDGETFVDMEEYTVLEGYEPGNGKNRHATNERQQGGEGAYEIH